MAVKDEFDKLAEHFGDMVEEMMSRNFFRNASPTEWDPHVNVYELHDAFVVCVDLAGMTREQIDIQVDRRVLHIRGNRPKPEPPGAEGPVCVHQMEIDSGQFHRELPILAPVDIDAIVATYRDGYLWINLPRRDRRAVGAGQAVPNEVHE